LAPDKKKWANDFGGEPVPLVSEKSNHLPGVLSSSYRFPSPVRRDSVLFKGNFVLRNGILKKKKQAFDSSSREGYVSKKLWDGLIGLAEMKNSIITNRLELAHLCFPKGDGYGRVMAYFLIESKRGFTQR